jgi:hypothetical protein
LPRVFILNTVITVVAHTVAVRIGILIRIIWESVIIISYPIAISIGGRLGHWRRRRRSG